ncbi:GerAB/ArcD/ProY family transporter [Bacillus sp. T3]|uniref:YkvI family membrane protein n=1 Tax=Bacillus sp. T3 TaxID=467262 RepID=UPI002980B1C4|nr:GerAB/ArcD/ProY family transporter [Bacillus sp. T3]
MKSKWSAAFQIAAVYVGTVVGAGFATGKEILEFFSRFGFFGFIGILISGLLLIFLGSKLLRLSAKVGAHSYQEFNEYLFGHFFGRLINIMTLLMLLGVCAVMLSGAGAVFQEQLNLPKTVGLIVTICLSILVLLIGMRGLFVVNIFVVPLMISFSIFLMFKSVQLPQFTEQLMYIPHIADGWKAVVTPFSYAAFNLFLAQAVLVPVATEIQDDDTVKWGGMLGGIALTLILLCGHFVLIMLPQVETYEVPMAIIVKNIASGLYWIYVFIIYGEIFTSVIGNVFGLERQLRNYLSLPSIAIICCIFISTYFISLVEYGELLSYLYPLFGYFSLVFIILLWMKPLKE